MRGNALARSSHTRRLAIAGDVLPVGCTLAVWTVILLWHPQRALVDDIARYVEIAGAAGKPYLDFAVEYPPLATLAIRIFGEASLLTVMWRVATLNAVASMTTWLVLRSHWSPAVGRRFLWFALPLQLFLPFRLDMVSVALAVGGTALADTNRQAAGGSTIAAGILFRLWPAVILPGLVIRDRARACVVAVLVSVIGAGTWLYLYGVDALTQIASFRGAVGWHIESVYGVLAYLAGDHEVMFEAGAQRVGAASPWAITATRVATVVVIALIWLRARAGSDVMGRPALAAVATLILFSPVSSPQYTAWLLPWAAIATAGTRSRDVKILTAYLVVLSSATFLGYWGNDDVRLIGFMAAGRAICLLALVIGYFVRRNVPTVDEVDVSLEQVERSGTS